MTLTAKTIPASRLSRDPDVADWLYEQAASDAQLDPLELLMRREERGEFLFHETGTPQRMPTRN